MLSLILLIPLGQKYVLSATDLISCSSVLKSFLLTLAGPYASAFFTEKESKAGNRAVVRDFFNYI
jgi:hypothetical protein